MTHRYDLEVSERSAHEIRFRVTGEVDLDVAPALLDSLLCAGLAYDAGHRVVVDLADVSFLDSSGLACLVEANRRLTAQEQVLVITNVDANVERLLSLTGLDQVLAIELAAAKDRDLASG
jgi:anti-sigma B factor antagonist